MRVMGLLSGTSVDGIDVAVVDFAVHGDGLSARIEAVHEVPYDPALRARIVAGAGGHREWCEIDTLVGQAFAGAAEGYDVDLVASLGQTLYHWVDGAHCLGTLQAGQAAWIAERLGAPVIADLRVRDVAAGGHGAPLAPLLDEMVLRAAADQRCAAVNIGGISNITVVDPVEETIGYDTGPGNALLDAAWERAGRTDFDIDGAVAAGGTVHEDVLRALSEEPYYRLPAPKSTGKELFGPGYLDHLPAMSLPDLLATLTELTAVTIAAACRLHEIATLYVSGGGAANPLLYNRIAAHVEPMAVRRTDDLGLPYQAKEAVLTALLGWLGWHGVAANLPGVTGSRAPRILGTITPGASPLRLPEPLTARPQWLRIGEHR
jgi:anhydro-N-acetylmuramic acid kinase